MKPTTTQCFSFYLLVILSCLLGISTAEIYQWVDEQGNVHFGDAPPENQQAEEKQVDDPFMTRVSKIPPLPISNNDLGQLFCGKRRLPFFPEDPLLTLSNVRPNLMAWERRLDELTQRYDEVRNRQREINANPHRSGDLRHSIEYAELQAAEMGCTLKWAKAKVKELEPQRLAFLQHVEQAQKAYDALENECGEKPDIQGWTQSETAKAWAKCQGNKSRINRKNQKLRELKRLKNRLHGLQ